MCNDKDMITNQSYLLGIAISIILEQRELLVNDNRITPRHADSICMFMQGLEDLFYTERPRD